MPQPPQPIVIQQRYSGGLAWRLLALLGWIGFIGCGIYAFSQVQAYNDYYGAADKTNERYYAGSKTAKDKIAIISLDGVIMEGDGFVKSQIDRVKDDDNIKAVLLRVDSPGGTVTGSDYIYHHLKKLREEREIPIVVSMGSLAASGGYYVSMAVGDQEKSIYAEPTTTTGSIGVIIPHYDISGLMSRFDVKDDSITSHPRKQMLAMTRPIPDEHRAIIQGWIDESFVRFKDIIKEGRPKFREDSAALDELATGEIYSATRAKELGLIDEIGFIDEALERTYELAGLTEETARVVRYRAPQPLIDIPFITAESQARSEVSAMLELSAPRAYYLATSMPPLFASYMKLLDR